MTVCVEPALLGGNCRAPASKSLVQRALACAALAPGRSRLSNLSWCADSRAAFGIIQALGARVEEAAGELFVSGGLRPPPGPFALECGESGLCLRLFAAIAALLPQEVELRGQGSLARRSVSMLHEPLAALGVSSASEQGHPPLRLRGPLKAGTVQLDGSESSQFITGLLLALPLAEGDSELRVLEPVSLGYLDLTLATMARFGVRAERFGPRFDAEGRRRMDFRLPGGTSYQPVDFELEGDWSAAAFLLVAGALAGKPGRGVEVRGLSPDSAQPDRAILGVLRQAGARVEELSDGARAEALPEGNSLSAFAFDARDCPDLLPPLVALASRCEGETRLRGASRLRGKESDRAAALVTEFRRLGLDLAAEGDELRIQGRPGRACLAAGTLSAWGDHRIAMAEAVAALAGSGRVCIEGAECVAKSFPDFFEILAGLTHR